MDVIEVIDGEAGRRALAAGMLACPSCGGTLRPWGRARVRTVRDGEGVQAIHPDRARCAACRATHVVLPAVLLPHRAYSLRVIGAALAGAARGAGHRPIAARLGVPEGTVRSWLRRARQNAGALYQLGVQRVVALDQDLLPAFACASRLAQALEALAAAALAAVRRFGGDQGDLWPVIAVVTRGMLLAPSPVT
jgi:transposase-like protein